MSVLLYNQVTCISEQWSNFILNDKLKIYGFLDNKKRTFKSFTNVSDAYDLVGQFYYISALGLFSTIRTLIYTDTSDQSEPETKSNCGVT